MTLEDYLSDLGEFITHYIAAIYFTEGGLDNPEIEEAAMSLELLSQIGSDCACFYCDTFVLWQKTDRPLEALGHDFWLTRNGHGAGFWDGDWPELVSKELTEIAEHFGEVDIYVGDDGLLYGG